MTNGFTPTEPCEPLKTHCARCNNNNDRCTQDGDVENIFQEAHRWSLGVVDDESFRAYLGEYLSGLRDMTAKAAIRAEAPSKCEFPLCAVHHICDRNCDARIMILAEVMRK